MSEVTLTERRTSAPLEATTWAALSQEPEFWSLVERGIVKVTGGRTSARLTPGPWVGRARCGDIDIQIVEKVPGTLRALWEQAHRADFRLEQLPSPSTDIGDLLPLIVDAFLREVEDYLRQGREFRYRSVGGVAPLAAGRINFAATAVLSASGRPQDIAFERPSISRQTAKNEVVAGALRTIRPLARLVSVPITDLSRADTMGLYFADCTRSLDQRYRRTFAVRAERLSEERRHRRNHQLLALASLLLRAESFEPIHPTAGSSPVTWFVNLEVLFERAVRNAAAAAMAGRAQVTKGFVWQRRVIGIADFDDVDDASDDADEQRSGFANPDLVVESSGAYLAVGDVKYKEWTGRLARSDLYQLEVHTAAFGAPASFIVEPAEAYTIRHLGMSAVGSPVDLVGVDPFDIRVGVEAYLATSGIL